MDTPRLSSSEEKRKAFDEDHSAFPKWLFVDELRHLLNDDIFKPDDWILCNVVGNLSIYRGDNGCLIAAIDFFHGEIHDYSTLDSEEE